MTIIHSKIPARRSTLKITVTVPPKDYQKHLEASAAALSERRTIKGFRPGHVPFDIVKREFGEMTILQEALERIISSSYYQVVTADNLAVVGAPKIEVSKVAPNNDVVYTAEVALLPLVTLADLSIIKVTSAAKPVTEEKIKETLKALRGYQAKEIIKSGQAEKTDKVVINLNLFLDNVPVDGGQATNYQVYLDEEQYIPGFNEQILGLQKGEEKRFSLTFPKAHYQKNLAGKTVEFLIKILDVYERQLPELNDEFAEKIGQKTVAKLETLIRDNLETEAKKKADEQAEIEILERLIQTSTFGDLPEIMLEAERQKMFFELKRDLERQGLSIEKYLSDCEKDEKQLHEDFKDQAEKRVKAALLFRQIAIEEHLSPDQKEIDDELSFLRKSYKDNKEYLANLKREEVRDTITMHIQNRKVMQWLKAKVLGLELIKAEHSHPHDHEPGHDH